MPITKSLNKSLIPIDGIPALKRIINQLDEFHIERIVVALGYLAHQVTDLLSALEGLTHSKVCVVVTPPSFSPAERLINSSKYWINSKEILLIYCDNLINNCDLGEYFAKGFHQSVLIQRRSPGNVSVSELGLINYHPERSLRLNFVELGYWILEPRVLSRYLHKKRDLPNALEAITLNKCIRFMEVDDYISISQLSRYTEYRNKTRLTVFLDRDGVVNKSVKRGQYLTSSEGIQLHQENITFLKQISLEFGVDYIVVTNQAGIERGIMTSDDVDLINQKITTKLTSIGVPILAFYVCPHHWDSNCECRKPRPGMLFKAISDFQLEPSRCLLIGDRGTDIRAGKTAGVKSFLLTEDPNSHERIKQKLEIIEALQSARTTV